MQFLFNVEILLKPIMENVAALWIEQKLADNDYFRYKLVSKILTHSANIITD